jgi:L-fucono-1,5-lactonase
MDHTFRIDAHQHFWKFDPVRDSWITEDMKDIRRDFYPYDLLPSLQESKMDGCIAVQASASESENYFLIQEAEKNDFIKGIVGWVDLTNPHLLERLSFYHQYAEKVKGFRHIVQAEPDDFLLREDFCRGIGLLQQYNFTYDILIYHQQLPATIRFVEKFPEQPFVIDHLAKPLIRLQRLELWATHMKTLAQFPNVYCKISGMVTEADWHHWKEEDFYPYLDVVTQAFGTKRLLFGSDWPVCQVAANYERVIGIIENFYQSYSPEEKSDIFGGNAISFYHL